MAPGDDPEGDVMEMAPMLVPAWEVTWKERQWVRFQHEAYGALLFLSKAKS